MARGAGEPEEAAEMFDGGPQWVIGTMSGTSLDGVDVALIKTDGEVVEAFGPWATTPYTPDQRADLARATQDAQAWAWRGERPESFAVAERTATLAHAAAIKDLLAQWSGPAPALIGFHGQTVLHRRPQQRVPGDTLQLGDGAHLAHETQLPVVYDLRKADVRAGGEGAPLAPIYHAALLSKLSPDAPSAALNIGGVANLTWRGVEGDILAFDTGPGNGPIDEWVQGHDRGDFDKDGAFAAAGVVHDGSLGYWIEHPYFNEPPPKSLDRYDFSANLARGLSFEDGAATLTAFAAETICAGFALAPEPPSIVVATGGGRLNPVLMASLKDKLRTRLVDAHDVGWRGDAIEAEAFAFLAARSVRGLPNSFPTTTGAPAPQTGGVFVAP